MLSGAITLPESLMTSLSTLVNNFTTSITNFIPTVLTYGLPIVAIIAFFALVWRYSRRIFRTRG